MQKSPIKHGTLTRTPRQTMSGLGQTLAAAWPRTATTLSAVADDYEQHAEMRTQRRAPPSVAITDRDHRRMHAFRWTDRQPLS